MQHFSRERELASRLTSTIGPVTLNDAKTGSLLVPAHLRRRRRSSLVLPHPRFPLLLLPLLCKLLLIRLTSLPRSIVLLSSQAGP